MGKIIAIVILGIGLIGGGLFWKLLEDIIIAYLDPYIIYNDYWAGSDLTWHMVPWLLILVGILSLILSGLLGRATRTVITE